MFLKDTLIEIFQWDIMRRQILACVLINWYKKHIYCYCGYTPTVAGSWNLFLLYFSRKDCYICCWRDCNLKHVDFWLCTFPLSSTSFYSLHISPIILALGKPKISGLHLGSPSIDQSPNILLLCNVYNIIYSRLFYSIRIFQ